MAKQRRPDWTKAVTDAELYDLGRELDKLPKSGPPPRKRTSFDPLTKSELREFQAELDRTPTRELLSRYQTAYKMCALAGDPPQYVPKPHAIQELVQLWKELHKRSPTGR